MQRYGNFFEEIRDGGRKVNLEVGVEIGEIF